MNNKEKIEKIEKKINKLRGQIFDIEKEEVTQVIVPKLKSFIGMCYRCGNSELTLYKILDVVIDKDVNRPTFITERICIGDDTRETSIRLTAEPIFVNHHYWNRAIPLYEAYEVKASKYNNLRKVVLEELKTFKFLKNYLINGQECVE